MMDPEHTNQASAESDAPVHPKHGAKSKGKGKAASKEDKETYASLVLPQEDHPDPSALKQARATVEYWTGKYVPKGKSPRRTFLMVGALAILLILFVVYMPNLEDAASSEIPDTPYLLDQSYDETVSESVESSRKTTAVIHMGPHKTGTTTVQSFSGIFTEELKEDGYHMPFDWIPQAQEEHHNYENQVEFASCFIQPYDNFEDFKQQIPCAPKLLLSGLEIGAGGKDMFVSAEAFDKSADDGLNALAAYLSIFDETIVAVFYRRYFEWLPSLDNQRKKSRKLNDGEDIWNNSILDFIQEGYDNQEINSKHAYYLVGRVEKHFENLELVNMHNKKDNNEELFCEVMPHADRTCEALKSTSEEDDSYNTNPRAELIYEDLAYNAMKQGLIDINTDQQLDAVSNAVQEYQEGTMGLTKNDFPMICLSPEVEGWLLDISLMIEEELLPEFFVTPLGEEALRVSFAEHNKTDLCKLDVDEVLSDDVWIDFFSKYE